jgi:hypothetical protein
MQEDHRWLRFGFSASAEIAPESSPTAFAPARVTEPSLPGCFVETYASFELRVPVLVKIQHSREHFKAEVSALAFQTSGYRFGISRNRTSLSRDTREVDLNVAGQPNYRLRNSGLVHAIGSHPSIPSEKNRSEVLLC